MTSKEQPIILFKVLRNMKSCNGGCHAWELGKKYTVDGELDLCSWGFHLTADPRGWLNSGCRVFFCEAYGIHAWDDENKKCVCRSVRLLKKQDPDGISRNTLAEWYRKCDAVDAKWNSERDAVYAKWNSERDAVDAKWNSERDAVDAKWNSERDAVDAKWNSERDAVYAKWKKALTDGIAELYRLQNKPRKKPAAEVN
jgi:hypothetical protein